MGDNVIAGKSKAFAISVIGLYKKLCGQNEYVLSRQVLRSGTSIGANVCEAVVSQSRKEFISKLNTALKEAWETRYWLELLNETDYIKKTEFDGLYSSCSELIKLLTSIIKSSNSSVK